MTIFSSDNRAGVQPIADVSSTQNHALGTIVRIQDSNTGSSGLGSGEAIYLQGASSTIVGSMVTYNPRDHASSLVTTSTVGTGAPVAVALSACNSTGSYGWYQISGVALVAKGVVDFATNAPLYRSAVTAGYVTSLVGSGGQFLGAVTANSASVSSTTSTIYVTLNRPHLQGQIL